MKEIATIVQKYDNQYIENNLEDPLLLNGFATTFFSDVAEIYDAISRARNVERNPTGFDRNDAPILGLLVRIWKLLKEIVRYYKENNADVISVLERPVIEASIMATFLMSSSNEVIDDYRRCSYKDRLRILKDLEEGSPFLNTKPGKRLLISIQEKLIAEGLTINDFQVQKQNRWRVQGKTFHDIFALVENKDIYACTYGMMSESIHGSWNESMDFCLSLNIDGTFSCLPFYQEGDIRFVAPTIRFTNRPYKLWLKRIEVHDPFLESVLAFIDRLNERLFFKFDQLYDGKPLP